MTGVRASFPTVWRAPSAFYSSPSSVPGPPLVSPALLAAGKAAGAAGEAAQPPRNLRAFGWSPPPRISPKLNLLIAFPLPAPGAGMNGAAVNRSRAGARSPEAGASAGGAAPCGVRAATRPPLPARPLACALLAAFARGWWPRPRRRRSAVRAEAGPGGSAPLRGPGAARPSGARSTRAAPSAAAPPGRGGAARLAPQARKKQRPACWWRKMQRQAGGG